MFKRGDGEERQERDRHDRLGGGPIEDREVRMKDQVGGEVTVIGQGASLEGTVVSAGSLRIDGQVKGKITAEGDVTLSPQSQVEADIQAQSVTVEGTFKGNIFARARAELARGGRVDGNVTTKTLIVAEGASFSGQSIMDQAGGQGRPDQRSAGTERPGQAQPQPAQAQQPAPAPQAAPAG